MKTLRQLSLVLIACALFCLTFAALAADAPRFKAHDALTNLLATDCFALGGMKVVNAPLYNETAFQALAAHTNALELFSTVANNGVTPEARLYGLTGIHSLAPAQFAAFARPLESSAAPVTIQFGCIRGSDTASNCVRLIRAGHYDQFVQAARK